MPGRLLLVSTPIGNLEDLSPRAARALAEADLVACEDTRHTGRLLAHLGLKKTLVSLHEHNERARLPQILAALEAGAAVAVVSDAGTPLLSDPGFPLVRAAVEAGHRVEPIPGPSAILAALVASGLPPYPFTFAGFPPPKSGKRRSFYRRLAPLRPHARLLRVAAPAAREPRGRPRRARRPPRRARPRADQAARGDALRPAVGARGGARRAPVAARRVRAGGGRPPKAATRPSAASASA